MERTPEGTGPKTTGNDAEEHEALREEGPRIYVASLSDYNNGILHGTWIDADQEPEELHEQVEVMLAASPTGHAEEFAIHDYEGFGQYRLGEYDPLERVSRIARGIREHGPPFAAWASYCSDDNELVRFEDAYLGEWRDIEAYADDLVDSFGWREFIDERAPEGLQPYVTIDVAGFAHDLELSGFITSVEYAHGVWIFDGAL